MLGAPIEVKKFLERDGHELITAPIVFFLFESSGSCRASLQGVFPRSKNTGIRWVVLHLWWDTVGGTKGVLWSSALGQTGE